MAKGLHRCDYVRLRQGMSEPSWWDCPCMRKPHPSVSPTYSHQIPALLSLWLSFSTWHCQEMGWSPQNPTHPGRASSHNIPWVLGPTWCFQHSRYYLASFLLLPHVLLALSQASTRENNSKTPSHLEPVFYSRFLEQKRHWPVIMRFELLCWCEGQARWKQLSSDPQRGKPQFKNCLRWFPNKLSLRMTSGTDKNWFMEAFIYDKYSIYTYIFKPVYPKGKQSWIFTERTDVEAEYFGHLMGRANALGKTLILGKIEGKRRRCRERMRWLDSITDSMDMNLSKLWEIVKDRGTWSPAVCGVSKSWTQLSDWTTATYIFNKDINTHSIFKYIWDKYSIHKHLLFGAHLGLHSGEGDGTPLQCSCLENPMDGGAW